MSALNLSAVMTGLAAAVQTVLASGRTAYDHPVEAALPGDAVVAYPADPIEVSTTFRRGQDRCVVPVYVICGLPQDETTRDAISTWIGDSSSVVTAIEGYSGTWASVSVMRPLIEGFAPVGQPPQLAVRFDVDVIS
jgi:hypothetical protein